MGLGLAIGQNVAAQSGGGAGTTWASNADWTLSNGNLTALRSGTSTFWGKLLASQAKANGTFILTINAIGSAVANYVGMDLGDEANNLGNNVSGHSIGYRNSDGVILFGNGTVGTFATWTTGDAIKIVKAGVNVSFYKNNVLQTTVDTSSVTFGLGTVFAGAAFPAVTPQNATGFQTTADFSGF